jgi:hypothetical protein
LTSLTPDEERPVEPLLIYASVSGSLGIVGKVHPKYEQILQKLEDNLAESKFIHNFGNLSHEK